MLTLIETLDQVAKTLLTPNHPFRGEALSQLATGMPSETAEDVLDDLFRQLTRPALYQLLEEELGDPLMLDRFCPRPHKTGLTRAYGPGRITHILPGNIPGIDVMSLVFALLVKSVSMAKISSKKPSSNGFPSLVPIFLKALGNIAPDLALTIALISEEPGTAIVLDEALRWADLVILYGSDQTVETVRAHIPSQTKTIVYGPKFSIGIVAHEMISRDVAIAAARDIALYDQRGCLSPHVFYVEEPDLPSSLKASSASMIFAEWVGEALDKIPQSPATISPETATTIQQLRGTVPLKGGTVFASTQGVTWTVLYDPDPKVTHSPLSRTVYIKPIHNLLKIMTVLDPVRSSLQSLGVALPSSRIPSLMDILGSSQASRICPIGKMQEPPLTWHPDGRFRILDLLRFVDWEDIPSTAVNDTKQDLL